MDDRMPKLAYMGSVHLLQNGDYLLNFTQLSRLEQGLYSTLTSVRQRLGNLVPLPTHNHIDESGFELLRVVTSV